MQDIPKGELINVLVNGQIVPLVPPEDMEMVIENGVAIIRPKKANPEIDKINIEG